jgi:hypothetical protein
MLRLDQRHDGVPVLFGLIIDRYWQSSKPGLWLEYFHQFVMLGAHVALITVRSILGG